MQSTLSQRPLLVALAALLLSLAGMARGEDSAPPAAEYRAAWITRFSWASKEPGEARANITRAMEDLAASGFNAAFFQVRGEAVTLYPSSLEPWSPLLGGKDPGFDPLEFAIAEARRVGLQIHAYINPIPLHPARAGSVPEDPNHLWHRHGPDSAEPWVCVDADGKPAASEYYYLSPGIPDVHVYLRQVTMDLVRRYDVDGVHLDRIRYPGPRYSHDVVSKQRFAGRGNPRRLEWVDWQREQLDKLVNDMAAEIRAEKPKVIFSAAVWGIYNRYNVPGYGGFSSGYHDYAQDSWRWVRLGAMDYLMPMIYWNIGDKKPDYDELMADFAEGVGPEHLVGGQRLFDDREETIRQIAAGRTLDAAGLIVFSWSSRRDGGRFPHLLAGPFAQPATVPVPKRLSAPTSGTILGTVNTADGQPLVDAWVSLKAGDGDGKPAEVRGLEGLTWTTSADGRFAFNDVPPGRWRVTVRYMGLDDATADVDVVAGAAAAPVIAFAAAKADVPDAALFLEVMSPRNGSTATADVTHVAGRTRPGNTATVGGEPVAVLRNGAFVRDNIALAAGENAIEVAIATPTGATASTTVRVSRRERPVADITESAPRPATARLVEPTSNVALLPGDHLAVRVQAPATAAVRVAIAELGVDVPLQTEDTATSGVVTFAGSLLVPAAAAGDAAYPLALVWNDGATTQTQATETKLTVWDAARPRLAEISEDLTPLAYGIHDVRLGGPYLAELPTGVRLRAVGQEGRYVRVRLSPLMDAYVAAGSLRWLPEGTPAPHAYFTSLHVGGDDTLDTVSIPIGSAKIPYAIAAKTQPNRIVVDLFGAHHASTWNSHRIGARVVGDVTVEQVATDHLRVTIPVTTKQIWGYWAERTEGSLVVKVRRPPALATAAATAGEIAGSAAAPSAANPEAMLAAPLTGDAATTFSAPLSPLAGMIVAVEAGHGGKDAGARGIMGLTERELNAAAALALEAALRARGASVVQCRPGDSGPPLRQRTQTGFEGGAQVFVALHGNSAGTERGFERVSGTSTYYKEDWCAPLARTIYREMLGLGWREFGIVGNFNYTPLRDTRMPSMLVEQAFMSNPADEARLGDPAYLRDQAEAIARGMEAWLNSVADDRTPTP